MLGKSRPPLLIMVFTFVSALTLLLSACGPAGTPTSNTGNDKPVRGGVWVDDFVNVPDSLIPNLSTQTFSVMAMQALYTPLFYGDPSGQIHPGLAKELPTIANGGVSADAKTWTFRLRPGLTWSDGVPLTADDIDFTWKLWLNPKFGAAGTATLRKIASAEVSADKLSITFHLKVPFAPFIVAWTDAGSAPLPMHHFASIAPETIKKSSDNLNPAVTNGPFMMSESKPDDHLTMVRNSHYYLASQGLPYLDKVVFRLVGNQNTILKDLQSDSITSAWFLDVAKLKSYQALTNYNVVTGPGASYEGLHFDQNNPALKDVNVRKAIAMAVNRDELVKTARQGLAIAGCTDHSQDYHPGYHPDASCLKFDLDAANKLLDDAGWVKGPDGVRQKNGLRLEFQYSTVAQIVWRQQDEELNQANFQKIGIKVNIQNYPASTFFSTFLGTGIPGKYDIGEWATSYAYDPNNEGSFACSQVPPNGSNFNFYCNPQLDALFTQEQATADPTARQQIFNQIDSILLTDLPIVPMFYPSDLSVVRKSGRNYHPGPFGASETVNIWTWWCAGGDCSK